MSTKENTGYIVQKIQRQVVASPHFMDAIKNDIDGYQHECFEAWKVENGTIKLEDDYGFHDQWTYIKLEHYGMMEDYVNKYKTSGTLNNDGKSVLDKQRCKRIHCRRATLQERER